MIIVHTAGIQDWDGAKSAWGKAESLFPHLRLVGADGGYAGRLVDWGMAACSLVRLPLHPSLTAGEQTYVIDTLYELCQSW